MNIYVGNLPRTVTEESLRQAFEQFGQVTSVKIIKDKFTGQAKGFGFLEMPTQAEAQQAIANMNGREMDGQKLRVNEAREPEARGPRLGGSRFGSGGDRNNRNGNGGGFRSRY